MVLPDGQLLNLQDMSAVASVTGNELWTVDRVQLCPANCMAFASYWATDDATPNQFGSDGSASSTKTNESTSNKANLAGGSGGVVHCTAVLQEDLTSAFGWIIMHAQKSNTRPFSDAPPPFYE